MQRGHAKLGHNEVYVAPCRYHTGPTRQLRDDLRGPAPERCRGKGDNRPSTRRARRTPDEVELPADPAVEPRPDRVRTHLPREVDLDRRVHRNHLTMLRDDTRVVRVVRGVHLHHRVVVGEVIQTAGAHHEGGDDPPGVDALPRTGDDTPFYEVYHAVREHLRVDAEVPMLPQRQQDGLGHRADP